MTIKLSTIIKMLNIVGFFLGIYWFGLWFIIPGVLMSINYTLK